MVRIEGKNIAIEYRFGEQKSERLPELAAELVRLKVDLIVTAGAPAALAAKKATTTIPIVMATTGDPVGAGLVASLARPGANVTGLSALSVDLGTKRLEILRDAVPKLVRVGLLWPGNRPAIPNEGAQSCGSGTENKIEEIETQADAKALETAFRSGKAETSQCDYDDPESY